LIVRHYHVGEDLRGGSHILFISASEQSGFPRYFPVCADRALLTVADMDPISWKPEGMIQFSLEGPQLLITINVKRDKSGEFEIKLKVAECGTSGPRRIERWVGHEARL